MAASSGPNRGDPLKRLLPAFVFLLAACGEGLTFSAWEDPRIGVAAEAPAGWTLYSDGGTGSPVGFDLFVHEPSVKVGGEWLGPTIAFHRLSRRRKEFPGTDAEFESYRLERLSTSESTFRDRTPGVSSGTVAGSPARMVAAEFTVTVPSQGNQKGGTVPMRVASVVIEKPEAFYVIEYRSNVREFQAYSAALQRAMRTLKLK